MALSVPHIPFQATGIPGVFSPKQLAIHITKHHQSYVDFLNKTLPGSEFAGLALEEIVRRSTGPVFNNAAQHYNHSFFWKSLTDRKPTPSSKVKGFFQEYFGGIDAFKKEFIAKASTIFGSGWCWLTVKPDKSVGIVQAQNAGNPLKDGGIPLLCVDTWEHTWYIDYENRKGDFFANFWDAVDWEFLEDNVGQARL